MAASVFTAIEINASTLFDGDGDVRQWMQKVTAEVKEAVKMNAPPTRSRAKYKGRPSTGALRRSISGNTTRAGALQDVGTVSVNAPHAEYVLGGTAYQGQRYIYKRAAWARKSEVDRLAALQRRGVHTGTETHGLYMRLPIYSHYNAFQLRVKGQRANNFLFDGYNEVARVHQALGTFRNPYAF